MLGEARRWRRRWGGAGGPDDRSDLRIVSVLMVTTTKRVWTHVNESVEAVVSNSRGCSCLFKVNWIYGFVGLGEGLCDPFSCFPPSRLFAENGAQLLYVCRIHGLRETESKRVLDQF
jgi:hypothetical protein